MSNFNTTSNQNQNIYPKSCTYGCNTQIYWNTATNEYWEVFTKKKHICPNRQQQSKPTTTTTTPPTRSTYYHKKPWSNTQPKPKMSNSCELLTVGPIQDIQKKYEIVSDTVIVEYNGKVHASQRERDSNTGLIDLLVYYEVLLGQRDQVKQRFKNDILKGQSS